jgi:hypothetical protein
MRKVGILAFTLAAMVITDMRSAAFAVSCSQGKSGCMQTGGTADVCQARYQSCMQSGCWNGALVQKCGYVKK